ncbi:Ferric reduction oxidase 7 [Globisporangium polare]
MAIQKSDAGGYYQEEQRHRHGHDDSDSLLSSLQSPTSFDKTAPAEPEVPASRSATKHQRTPHWRSAAQVGVLLCMVVYAFGQVMYLSPLIQDTFVSMISPWLGITVTGSSDGRPMDFIGGHGEMLRPMFFVVWGVLPLLASLVLYELTHGGHSSRRVASRFVMQVGAFLRRKPRLFGSTIISPFGYGELLFQLLLIGGNMALFWYGWVYERQYLPILGDAYTFDTVLELSGIVFGYSCVFNMAFLLLPSTRNCAWMDFFGISYANGVKYHRWLGVLTLFTGVLHAAPFYWWWSRQGTLWQNSLPCFDCALDYYSPGYPVWFNVFGELSLIFLLLVGVTSIPHVRRKMFETFYYTHHLYILGVVFAVMHWVTIIWWLLPSLVLYLISRSVSTWNATQPVRVLEFTSLPDDIIKIVLARSRHTDGEFQIGQFVYLNVPAISRLQWHAFTIASAPRSSPETFAILLKSLGDWTKDLVELAEASKTSTTGSDGEFGEPKSLPTMLVDGFYGSSLECYEDFETLCLIGGGIGVTPLFAILEDIVAKVSGNAPAAALKQRVHFVFSFRELSLLEEIHPVLTKLRELDPHSRWFSTRFYLTRQPSEAVLTQKIDYARSLSTSQATRQGQAPRASSWLSPQPFAEPLRSRASRIGVYVVMLSSSTLIVLWLEWGGGRLMASGTQWWPLEAFVEIAVLFALPVLVFVALTIEKFFSKRGRGVSSTESTVANQKLLGGQKSGIQSYSSIPTADWTRPLAVSSQATDVLTLGDLVSEYDVVVGQRPDMTHILTQVHQEFQRTRKTQNLHCNSNARGLEDKVGVFISGPEALKSATESAISGLGPHSFDIHEEEFEL